MPRPNKYEMPLLSIDDPITTIQDVPLNSLAYSLRLGHTDIFTFLLKCEASIVRMEACYKEANKTSMDIA
jgi:hypothetical protein